MKRWIIFVVVAVAVAVPLAIEGRAQQKQDASGGAAGASSDHQMTLPDQLKWEDAKMLPPGAKIAILEGDPQKEGFIAMRAKFPAGYRIPPHWHPCPERVTVLSGKFHMGTGEKFDEKSGHALPVGAYAVMPPQVRHFAWTEGETIVQLSTIGPWGVTYVNESDDPRKGQK